MFINAEPRHVSNDCFQTFVHRPALHQRLVKMTNNDINAWGRVFRSAAAQATDTWDEQLNDFSSENFSVQSPFPGYYQDTGSQAQGINLSKPLYQSIPQSQQPQYNHYKTPSQGQQTAASMNCFEKTSPMLDNEYSSWNVGGQTRGSFSEFSGMQNSLKDFTYQPLMDPVISPFSMIGPSCPSNLLQSSYLEDGSILGSVMNMDKTSPSTVYSGCSTSSQSIDPRSLTQFNMSNSASSTGSWWPETPRNSNSHSQNHGILPSHDGLPRYQMNSHVAPSSQFNDPWTMTSSTSSTSSAWPSHDMASKTISPQVLTLNISSAPLSISGSSQGSVLQLSDSSSSESSEDDQSNYSSPESFGIAEPQPRRLRQILPSDAPMSRRLLPILPSNDDTSRATKKRPTRAAATSTNDSRRKSTPPPSIPRPSTHKRIEPKPVDHSEQFSQAPNVKAAHFRDARDDFLVRSKLAGMSYKDIRKKGKFTEAESTLRGRFRTLTKHKTARVRKPEWNDNDLRLLKKAVRKLTKNADLSKCKVPWKQVAEYIAENGGSYHFGNATCRKRWDELQADA